MHRARTKCAVRKRCNISTIPPRPSSLAPRPLNLADWLDYQQRVHPRSIDLGLARVREVWERMGAPRPAPIVITVGGTNGKGSTVAFLQAMLGAMGRRVGCYTSPHLLRYNERVRLPEGDVADARLIEAFERIEAARMLAFAIPLTYFEFGTLAALWIFSRSELDVAVLEVGLGGRLDAVNIVDADAAIVTTVDLDHQDWLGNDRDSIGREKAGIFRQGRPAILGMAQPPAGLLDVATAIGAKVVRAGRDFDTTDHAGGWQWRSRAMVLNMPHTLLAAPCQHANAAAAVAALYSLRQQIGWDEPALATGVRSASLPARLQRFARAGAADLVVDVAHNPQAARVLAQWLDNEPIAGCTIAVFAALSDKDVRGMLEPLTQHIDHWFICGLDTETPRGLPASDVIARCEGLLQPATVSLFPDPEAALGSARGAAHAGDRIIVFGSFYLAAAALESNAWADGVPAEATASGV